MNIFKKIFNKMFKHDFDGYANMLKNSDIHYDANNETLILEKNDENNIIVPGELSSAPEIKIIIPGMNDKKEEK